MIVPADILPNNLVKVLVEGGDEYYASVLSNEGEYLFVTYLVPILKNFKTAPVHEFESKAERVDFESITEHHFDSEIIKKIGKNMYVFIDEIDTDSESEIETESSSDDSEDDSLDSFIVSDEAPEGTQAVVDTELNNQWDSWSPRTPSAIRYKETVNRIEAVARIRQDDINFSAA